MPPQTKITTFGVAVTQAALPFNTPVYEKNKLEDPSNSTGNLEGIPSGSQTTEPSSDLEDASVVRITTRARRTYELDRYEKHAMLIIENKTDFERNRKTHNLDEAFKKFGFEVEAYENLTRDEIVETCDRFFQKDFSDYGALAVVLSTTVDNVGCLKAYRSLFKESVITSHFTTNLPTTLKGKPIIYITEIPDLQEDRALKLGYPNILNYHIPNTILCIPSLDPECELRPLQFLSNNIMKYGDKKNLLDVMTLTTTEIVEVIPLFLAQNNSVGLFSTLTEELVLKKS